MQTDDVINQANTLVNTYLVPFGWKILGAIAVWILGGWIARFVGAGIGRTLTARKVDPTLGRYIEASANVLMKILVLIAVFGVLGIETTSFAALLAALGIAIGAAWAGLLSNFAAGIFLMTLRPFKVGDMITVAGVTGDVREIGLFVTALDNIENVRIFVGNAKIFADTIYNYTTNPHRRVDLTAQIAHSVDPYDAIRRLAERVAKIPNVLAVPAPSIEILTFNEFGTVIAVRPYCHNNDYWQVFFDTNKAIVDVGGQAGYATPERRLAMRSIA
jgi:small conductance mechanosensitive channel